MKWSKSSYLSRRIGILSGILTLCYAAVLVWGTCAALVKRELHPLLVLGYLFFFLIIYIAYSWIYKPYRDSIRILTLFSEGYLFREVFHPDIPFCEASQRAFSKLEEILKTDELISVSKKQAEYLALQNQINPHFLYNTLEGIRSEALLSGMDQVAEMTEALATFFRYTISHVEHLVTLEDELANIENYYIIQQFRFGEKLNLKIEFDHGEDDEDNEMEMLQYQLPKLTLQPIVENSIYHGIERKIGNGTLRIKIQTTQDRLLITVSDDGLGMSEEKLIELNRKLGMMDLGITTPQTDKKGGIAMLNVNNRIKLLFGEEYGINIYSTIEVGTDVEITLPLMKE